jgi:hypothetical protein
MSNDLKKEKLKFRLRISGILILVLVTLILLIRQCNEPNQIEEPNGTEITELVHTVEAGDYDINNVSFTGNFKGNKEALIYDLERIVRHLESVYMTKALVEDKEDLLNEVVGEMNYRFCASKPRIFLTFDNTGGEFSSSDEILDIILLEVKRQYYIVRVDVGQGRNSDCIEGIYFYVKEYHER